MTGPWISGESLSPSRLNLHQGGATLVTGFSTDTLQGQSGLTVNVISDLSVQNTVAAQRIELGGAPSSTSGLLSLRAHSQQTDYLFLQDSTGIKSNYLLGLRTGDSNASQVDGLNLYDTSANTTIVRFSSNSVRFYAPLVAPVFDTGGALASTYNAALFLRGSSKESQIQAAINAAVADGIKRVYIPASMYPYSAGSVVFDNRVQLVREGGNWSGYDIRAYGAALDGVTNDTSAYSAWRSGALAPALTVPTSIVFPPAAKTIVSGVTNTTPTLVFTEQVGTLQGGSAGVVSDIAGSLFFRAGGGTATSAAQMNGSDEVGFYIRKYGVVSQMQTPSVLEAVAGECSPAFSFTTPGGGNILGGEFMGMIQGLAAGGDYNGTLYGSFSHADFRGNGNGATLDIAVGLSAELGSFSAASNYSVRKAVSLLVRPPQPASIGTFLNKAYAIYTDGAIGLGDWPAIGANYGTPHFQVDNTGAISGFLTNDVVPLSLTGAPQVNALNLINVSGSWNSAAATFIGLQLNVTVNAAAAASKLLALQQNNSAVFSVNTVGATIIAASGNGATQFTVGGVDGNNNYSVLDGLRIAGEDVGNTLYNATRNISITRDSGGNIFIGQTSGTNNLGIRVNTTTGASQYTDGTALAPSVAYSSESSLGLFRSGVSTLALSYGSLNLNQARLVSMRTAASLDSTSLAVNEAAFTIVAGSAAQLAIRSGGTVYYFASSSSTKG